MGPQVSHNKNGRIGRADIGVAHRSDTALSHLPAGLGMRSCDMAIGEMADTAGVSRAGAAGGSRRARPGPGQGEPRHVPVEVVDTARGAE